MNSWVSALPKMAETIWKTNKAPTATAIFRGDMTALSFPGFVGMRSPPAGTLYGASSSGAMEITSMLTEVRWARTPCR
ncbi:hypothetical protein GCM10022419_065020 [Nonomuraea rosea]|uniref:RES domain-containing protein n=1 Tax=Nonomuraea rosea TaxID=638574 RepID=A0ABP6Y0A7_9ACTN